MLIESFLADALLEAGKKKLRVKKGKKKKGTPQMKRTRNAYPKAAGGKIKGKKVKGSAKVGSGGRSKALMKYAKAAGAKSPKAVFGAIMRAKGNHTAGGKLQKMASRGRKRARKG